ncbi:MAG: hypothetical protein RBS23_04800 [Mariniphaga sp.]|jgi:hypothetical protein|nr:hypothetical protein [Mariniphaga sp.]
MKRFTLFIVKKIKCNPVVVSQLLGKTTGKISEEMKSAAFEPSAQTIRKILDFAQVYNVIETKTAGHAEMILN